MPPSLRAYEPARYSQPHLRAPPPDPRLRAHVRRFQGCKLEPLPGQLTEGTAPARAEDAWSGLPAAQRTVKHQKHTTPERERSPQVCNDWHRKGKWSSTHRHHHHRRRRHHHHHLPLRRARLVPSDKLCSKTSCRLHHHHRRRRRRAQGSHPWPAPSCPPPPRPPRYLYYRFFVVAPSAL